MITGRQRRKKCDELQPICSNCTRNGFLCSWPKMTPRLQLQTSTSQSPSSNTLSYLVGHISSNLSPSGQTRQLVVSSSLPCSLSVIGFESEAQSYIFRYCMDIFLPWQVHYQSGFLYEDPSYMMSISLHFNHLLVPPSHILQIYYLTPHFPRNFHKCEVPRKGTSASQISTS